MVPLVFEARRVPSSPAQPGRGLDMRLASRIAPVLAATLLAACGSARKLDAGSTSAGVCVACHGGADNATGAPPKDTRGRTDTTLVSVGAHSAHVAAGIDCGVCHPKPATVDAPRHADGHVDLAWSPLATANGKLTPAFDEAGATCSNVYCHGAFKGGNEANAPRWTRVGQGEGACGTCHGLPPPRSTGHPQVANCGGCHPGYTRTSVNAATHLDGMPEVGGMTCTSCHGDSGRAATVTNPQLAASPPSDVGGNTATSAPGVGAHQAHLTDGALRLAMPCTECHAVPASLDAHPTGTTELAWDPQLAATRGAAPVYRDGRCASTYCHGATLGAGGTNHEPRWTGGPAEAACGTCHGFPPPAPHPQLMECGRCHPGYDTAITGPGHVNGRLDLLPMTCTSCHGNPARTATLQNPQLPAAPPIDTLGRGVSARVGAHQIHLNGSAIASALACTECHVVPTAPVDLSVHPTGTTTVPLQGVLATGSGTTSPSFAGGTCSSTYCHGATLGAGNGSNHAPSWNGGPGEAACGTCHGIPPPAPHKQNPDCGRCHPGYSNVAVRPATHVNGRTDLDMTCTSCHGDPARTATLQNPQLPAAPPTDTLGRGVSARVGAHQIHLNGSALASALACTECHVVPTAPVDLSVHPAGATTVPLQGVLATGSGTANPSFAGGVCSGTYCHGATLGAGGTKHAPSWNGGPSEAACGTCHAVPPPVPHVQNPDCGRCHPGYSSSQVNLATHVNGRLDLVSLTCWTCHGDPARPPSLANPDLPAAPPTDTLGQEVSARVGAHQAHLTDGALRVALPCTECHVVPASLDAHPTGTTELAWNPLLAAKGTSPSYAGGTCASTYCHGATLGADGTNHAPRWTGGPAEAACGTCHAVPPPVPHVQNSDCGRCHPGYSSSQVNVATHVNGRLDLLPLTCTSCHGDPARTATLQNPQLPAAPPTDTTGAQDSPRVGAHQAHLTDGALSVALPCAECHAVPASLDAHPTGTTTVPLQGNLATGFGTTNPSYAAGTCSSTYCHGGYSGTFTYSTWDWGADVAVTVAVSYVGNNASPTWGGTAPCGSCHGIPPTTGTNAWHSGAHGGGNDCSLCHPDATGTSAANASVTDPSRHVDGKIDFAPKFKSSCYGCH
jgi:predicted CxxxxCH...CXXCH cytochrome family protein